jgi:hypothetical protein
MKTLYFFIIGLLLSNVTLAQITSDQVIANSNTYINHSWTASASNIWNKSCGGKTVKTPFWVKVGKNDFFPYCWGGNNNLSEFDSYLLNGKSAGDSNTETTYGAEPGCAVGVDCSGFVSRCYGLSTHYATVNLNTNSLFGHHNSMNNLRVGDFINKPGKHTRLVTKINSNGTINVIEAGSGIENIGGQGLWRVFTWSYSTDALTANGYKPQYYTKMTTSTPSKPGSFTLTLTPECDGTTSQIRLNWTASANATSYEIYRDGTLYFPTDGTKFTGTQFINKGSKVIAGINYSYYVKAINSAGNTNSSTKSVTAQNCASTGFASVSQGVSINPTSVISGANFTTSFSLKETKGSSITFEKIVCAITTTNNVLVRDMVIVGPITIPANGTYNYSSTLAWRSSDATGNYRAWARGKVVGGDWFDFTTAGGTNPKSFQVVSGGNIPGSFSLTLTPECYDGTTSQIRLNWTESANATSYEIYRNGTLYYPTDGSKFTGTQFENRGSKVVAGTSYSYYVKAINSVGSTNSSTKTVTAPDCSCNLSLSKSSLNFTQSSGSNTVNVTSNSTWLVNDNASWITVSPTSGSNNKTLTISVTTNSGSQRSGTVTVSGCSTSKSISVSQSGITPTLNVTSTSLSLGSTSGSKNTFNITSNVSWSVSDNATWLSVSPTSGSNNGTITVTASSANTASSSRSATVTVTGGGITKTVTVTQLGTPTTPSLTVSTSNLSIANASGSNNTFNITSNVSWSVSDNATWLSVSPTNGSNNGTITVTASSANTASSSRTATVTVTGGGITKTVTVTQLGTPTTPSLTVSTSNLSIANASGSNNTFNITSNVSWSVSDNATWLTVSPTNGSNNGTITVTASSANTASSSRTATVTVTGGGITKTVTVTQLGTPTTPSLTVSTSNLTIASASGSNNTFSINSNVSWSVSDNAAWLSVSPTSGSNNGTITVTASSANTAYSSRSATVTVTGGGITKTVTVTQLGTPTTPSLSVSTSNLTIASASGSNNTFSINSNVSWSVSDNAAWLSVSPTSGSNNGTITVTASSANTAYSSRSATVTVTGGGITKTLTVTQAGEGALQYIINIASNPENWGRIIGGGLYSNGQLCTVKAVENPGFEFINWTENGVEVASTRNYTFLVAGSRELVANFIENTSGYTISISGEPVAGGFVFGDGSYYYGENCKVIAVANEHFTFSHWIENGIIVSNESIYTFDVTGNSELVAIFRSKDIETAPNAPDVLPATNIFTNCFSANWNHSVGAKGYILDVATTNTFTNFVTGFQNKDVGNVNSFTISGLAENTTYFYRLRAYNQIGKSEPSHTITAATKLVQSGSALFLGTVTGVEGSILNVPVTAFAFNRVASMQFSISYDNTKLRFLNCSNFNDAINPSELQVNPLEGIITFTFFTTEKPLSISHGRLFDLNFSVEPGTDGASSIKWIDLPTPKEISNTNMERVHCSYIDGGISIISGFSLSGQLLYNNADFTPLKFVPISLFDSNNQSIANASTNSDGNFSFEGLSNGTYTLSPEINFPWGGATAMDLTLYKRHIGSISALNPLQIKSGDVNGSNSLTSLDLNIIKQRIGAKISSFDAGDWAFENETVTINESNVQQNIMSLCYGDANASYNSSNLKSNSNIFENFEGDITFLPNNAIEIPIHINRDVRNLSSVTLFIDFPVEQLSFKELKMKAHNEDLYYTVNDNVITIVYSTLKSLSMKKGEELMHIQFSIKRDINNAIRTENQPFLKGIGEFGDFDNNLLNDINLLYDDAKLSILLNKYNGDNVEIFPNPAKDELTITNCDDALLNIYDVYGRKLIQLKPTSNHFQMNVEKFRQGVYTIEILKNENIYYQKFYVIK